MQPGSKAPRPGQAQRAKPARTRNGPATPFASRPRRSRREYVWIAISLVVALVMVMPFFGGGTP